jgi:hydrogenase maturation protease
VSVRVRILCFGNLLAGDDGFGIHVHRSLQDALTVPEDMQLEILDAGVSGMSALSYFEDCEHVIVVDALRSEGQIGSVHRLELSELRAPESAFSAHALDLTHLFHVLPIIFEGRTPPTISIVGAEIAAPSGNFELQLSAALQAAIEPTVACIRAELAALRPPAPSASTLTAPNSTELHGSQVTAPTTSP